MSHHKTWNRPHRIPRDMQPVVFKRWSNRGWAVLASFHKLIIIGILCCSYNMLGQNRATGQADSSDVQIHMELEEVESLAESHFELERISLKPLIIVSSPDIISEGYTSHEELLEYLPQLDIRQRGKHGTQADLTIQGGSFDQTMVLLNGINLSDPQTGHFHLNLPVDLSAIFQVEVLTGSAARRFGTYAFTGAVNFVTQPQDTTGIHSGFRYGQYNFYKAFLNANVSGKYLSTMTSISTSGSDGYRENTDFRSTHLYIHSSTRPGKLKAHLIIGLNTRDFGANAFYSPRFAKQYEETNTSITAFKLVMQRPLSSYTFNAYLRVNKDYFLLDKSDPAFYRNDHLTRVLGSDLNGRFSSTVGVTHGGIQTRREAILSTSLGELLEPGGSKVINDDITFSRGHTRNQLNLNINHTFEGRWVSLEGGILLHLNSDLGFEPTLLPGLDIKFQLSPTIHLLTTLSRSMRLPTFTDLYYQGPTNVGNPDLTPEKATTFELGIYGQGKVIQAAVNGFYRQGRDLIDWIWMEDEKWHTLNLTEIDAMGGDLSLEYGPGSGRNDLFSIEKMNFSYTFTYLTKVSEEVISRYLLDNLRHKVAMGTNMSIMKNLNLRVRFTFQDRDGSYMKYDMASGLSIEQPYEPFLLMDAKLSYSFRKCHIFLETTNLLNIDYCDIGNVIQPGRWTMAGIEIR